MASRPLAFPIGEPSQIAGPRIVSTSGGAIVADPSQLTDANYPIINDSTMGGQIRCNGMKTIWVGAKLASGDALPDTSTLTIEALVLDEFGADDAHWTRMLDASGNPYTVTISNAGFKELFVGGRTVFLRVSAVGGTTIAANVVLLAFAGEMYLP